MNPQLLSQLRQLRLSGMAEALPLRLEQARSAPLDCAEFLELIVATNSHAVPTVSLPVALSRPALHSQGTVGF